MSKLLHALSAWKNSLGPQHVSIQQQDLVSAETATFATTQKVKAILYPGTADEVVDTVRIASRFRIPLYPVSGGQNCGYGTRVPYCSGSVLVDLRRLNRILDYDEKLAYVTLEPGVTQDQLRLFLIKKGGKLWIDPISTSPSCSVIGNILERGHGMTPYADRISSACNFEVVLGSGTRIVTGNSGFRGAKTGPLDRWRVGPNLDGLFSQSGLGIVTKMSVWLMPAPEYVEILGFTLKSDKALAKVIDKLRPLRLDGTLNVGPRMVNEYRHIQNLMQYPWSEMKGQVPLAPTHLRKIMQQHKISPWTGFVGLYGSFEQVSVNRKRSLRALGSVETRIRSSRDNEVPKDVFSHYLKAIFTGMTGGILPVSKRPYWRKKITPAGKFEQDGCGIMWCPISVPLDGRATQHAVEIYRETIGGAGYEPDISISSIRARTLEVNVSIIYDRNAKGEDQKSSRCSRQLMTKLMQAGFTPHRLGLHSMQAFAASDPGYLETVEIIRKVLDPNGIVAPGRY